MSNTHPVYMIAWSCNHKRQSPVVVNRAGLTLTCLLVASLITDQYRSKNTQKSYAVPLLQELSYRQLSLFQY